MTNEERKDKQPKNHKTAQAPAEHSESINLEQINGSDFDFYSANSDYICATMINQNHEIVNYHNGSTVRIWYNEQLENFPLHWHNSLEIILPVTDCYYVITNDTTHCIHASEIYFIPPGELHSVYPPPLFRWRPFCVSARSECHSAPERLCRHPAAALRAVSADQKQFS